MNTPDPSVESFEPDRFEMFEAPRYRFSLSRRAFVQSVGAGLLLTAYAREGWSQETGEHDKAFGGRFHFAPDGKVTVFCGKVEVGQGSRTEVAMAAAEELHVPLSSIVVVMADTALTPNDGGSAGSQTTPRTVPAVRKAAVAARELLVELACDEWKLDPKDASIENGTIKHSSGKQMTLGELVNNVSDFDKALSGKSADGGAESTPDTWQILGKPATKITAADFVTGRHRYPSDIHQPKTLYGAVLRAPSYNATLVSVDTKPADKLKGVVVVHDGEFVGCAAPTSHEARKAVEVLAANAKWDTKPHVSSVDLWDYLKKNTREGSGRDRGGSRGEGDVDGALKSAAKVFSETYHVPYIQHAPMETRSAAAEWERGKVTVWVGTQQPQRVRDQVAQAFSIQPGDVRIIVPDSGGGFGGKHTAEAAIEAARLAQAAKKPVSLQWSREDEFAWAYFRPAALIEISAGLDKDGAISAWDFVNYNSGGSGIECPYTFANKRTKYQACESPLRTGSYRALASTANNFAREVFIDRLAAETQKDPFEFRRAHLDNERLKAVLEACANKYNWAEKRNSKGENKGVGIACGTEKASYVATCAEVTIDPAKKQYKIENVCVAFECGAILNPQNLRHQVEGCIIMGLGAVLREAMEFQDGKITNNQFKKYEVPHYEDVPPMDVILVNRPDLSAAGAGETPIIGIAPAVANAIYHATGNPLNALPLKLVLKSPSLV
jgi:CO/xanthine dehydrogenase Mo-binding subunit